MATGLTSEEATSYERLGFLSPLRASNPDEAAGYRARLEEFERQVAGPITSDKVDVKYRYRLHTLLPWAHELATMKSARRTRSTRVAPARAQLIHPPSISAATSGSSKMQSPPFMRAGHRQWMAGRPGRQENVNHCSKINRYSALRG
mgnify:CR=1 FL=1